MPPTDEPAKEKTLEEVVEAVGLYPIEAYRFVHHGLMHTVNKLHGAETDPEADRHVAGADLCEGLRELALKQWGLMAQTVLKRWNVTSTLDFGRIVFAYVDNGLMQKTDRDTLDDFRNVYDFRTAFESGYKIEQGS